MLIRSTNHACYVMLHNGLTLELAYDLDGLPLTIAADGRGSAASTTSLPAPRSHGVWIFQEEVVLEVCVGQA